MKGLVPFDQVSSEARNTVKDKNSVTLTNVTMNVAEIFLETDTYWRQTHDGQNWPPRSFIYVREVTTFSLRCVLLAKVAQWRWWWGHHYTTLHMHTCGFVWKFPAFISAFEVTRGHLQPTTRLEAVTWGFSMTICFLVLLWVLRRPIPASYTRALQHFGGSSSMRLHDSQLLKEEKSHTGAHRIQAHLGSKTARQTTKTRLQRP